ncbi:hypothetical protein MKW92_041332 [Papaver armeniacum]|nr:hypothetical protein MKW92_041332 [Papaver armeniacum]
MPSSVLTALQVYGELQLLTKLEDGTHAQLLRTWIYPYVQVSTAGNLSMSLISSTYKALRYQQHRWSCGPANLFRKMGMDIIRNEKYVTSYFFLNCFMRRISLWRKIHVIYNFFLVRKMITHITGFIFYCVIIPMCVMFPEVEIPKWGAVNIPTAIMLLNIIETPRFIPLFFFWISLETVMSMTRMKGILTGLLDRKRVSEWVVTEKLGDVQLKSKDSSSLSIKSSRKPPLLERYKFSEFQVALCFIGTTS